jgi:uncharacterized membrane protein
MKLLRKYRLFFKAWAVPMNYALGAILIGMILPRIETRLIREFFSPVSVESAIAICSSVASGMITLTGIVFSLTFVMVQFSASAYSPRLVLWVARTPVMTHALGVFTATFLYALALLAWIHREKSGNVPFFSSWLLFFFLIASVAMFVALVNQVAFLQVGRMLVYSGDHGRKVIDVLYPPISSAEKPAKPKDYHGRKITQTLTHSGRPQVIQAVHSDALATLAEESDSIIEMAAAVGDTMISGLPLMRIYGGKRPVSEKLLKDAIAFGDERTFEQDPKYALRIVVDIAIKALSPAINDPTTAVQALDQIEDLLIRLGQRRLEIGATFDRHGELRLVVPFPKWEAFLRLSLDEIHSYGANSVQVMRRMNALINNLLLVLPEERHAAVKDWEQRLKISVKRSFQDVHQKQEASVGDRQGFGIGQE